MVKFHFTKSGHGCAIVLIHGWGGSLTNLEGLEIELSKYGFTVFNLELKGFGKTEEPETPWVIRDFSNYVIEFCKSQKLHKPILIGHSFGGKIVLDIAINKLFDLGKIVLIGSDGIFPYFSLKKTVLKFAARLKKLLPINLQDSITEKFYIYVLRQINYIKVSDVMKQTLINCGNAYYGDRLEQIKIPTLIIWGAKDKVTPLWMAKELNKRIAGSKLEIIEDIGHALPLKHPEYIAELIRKNEISLKPETYSENSDFFNI